MAVIAFALMEADATLTADEAEVLASVLLAQQVVDGFRDGSPYRAFLDAVADDAFAAADAATLGALEYAAGDYEAKLKADGAAAKEQIQAQIDLGRAFRDGDFGATITANNDDAILKFLASERQGDQFAEKPYIAELEGDPSNAFAAADAGTLRLVQFATRDYTAQVDADPSGAIAGANRAQGAINSVRGRTVYINVITVQRTITQNAEGGIWRYYANGGLEQHSAQIAPAGAMRVWAEPETGGEAYIPLGHAKRPQSTAILNQVAQMFGYQMIKMAEGGFVDAGRISQASFAGASAASTAALVGGVSISATIPITIQESGDPERVRRLVAEGVREGLTAAGHDLRNRRLGR